MYTMQTRQPYRVERCSTLAAALAAGYSLKEEFDVSADSGALLWVWEMRE